MANFQPFDLGRAVNAGTQNAIAMMQARQMGDKLKDRRVLRETATEASQPVGHPGVDQTAGDYDAGRHAELLGERGRPMMANEISRLHQQRQAGDIDLQMKKLSFITKTAPMVRDEGSYNLWRTKAEQFGALPPGSLPEQYNEQTQGMLRALQGKAAEKLSLLTMNLPGGMQQQYAQRGGELTPVGDPVSRWKPGEGDGSGSPLKPADENAIYRQAAGLFGGTWDPQSGRVLGLNREQTSQVQAITERAAALYYRREAPTRSEAVTRAARDLGINVRNLGSERKTARAADEVVDRDFGGGPPAGRPGPFKANAPESKPKVIRYDAQGNRITE